MKGPPSPPPHPWGLSTAHLQQQSVIFYSTKLFGLAFFWKNAEIRRKPPLQNLSSSLLWRQNKRLQYIKLQFCLFFCTNVEFGLSLESKKKGCWWCSARALRKVQNVYCYVHTVHFYCLLFTICTNKCTHTHTHTHTHIYIYIYILQALLHVSVLLRHLFNMHMCSCWYKL